MSRRWIVVAALAALTGVRASAIRSVPLAVDRACSDLAALTIPDTGITSAAPVPAGAFTPPGSSRSITVPAFCRVAAVAAPSSDSHIAIEVWIPDAWNGKLLGTANGGFAGAIGYPAMAAGLARGYAVVGTDTGHIGDQLEFADGHPEKVVDWAYRSIHVMTDVAKLVVRAARGQLPSHAYFEGCSTGGQQALSEAQRYPDDYDGIVAGDPGHNRVRLILGFLWSWIATHDDDRRPVLPVAKLPAIAKAAVAACDASDGVKDGVIGDPRTCRFDPKTLACTGAETDACLTPTQVAAVEKVYAGAKNPRTGEQILPGWVRGSEQGWGTYIINPREPARVGFFRALAFHDPHWDWRTFDWDRDVAFADAQVPYLSATSRDLRAFQSRGGKLVMYTGWADPVVPPQDTVAYYDEVVKASGGLARTQSFFRFFPVPGMAHCGGGSGTSTFDALGALEAWIERGTAPQQLLGQRIVNGAVERTRPICAYPTVARYRGTGSTNAAESFACVDPASAVAASTPRASAAPNSR
jgi:feruloyl esterase